MIRRGYESEFTAFIDQYIADHPPVLDVQRTGRAMFWDRSVDHQAVLEAERDTVPAEVYFYYGWPGVKPP